MSEPKWTEYDDDRLLDKRIFELGLKIEGTEIEGYINDVYKELTCNGLNFLPQCYLADEWLCPDEEPIVGIPFYLAHPRLKKLEKKMILEVEGGTKEEFLKLLRHEIGHAYNYAYRLYKKRKWKEIFGSFDEEYPETYIPRPYSKKYVRHIENCYAQYHPDEDFAETFAVWLTPESNWREHYKGWKGALRKLEYVDELMSNIKGKKPLYTSSKRYWSAEKSKQKLGFYYKKKRREYAEDLPGFFDPDLKKIFCLEDSKEGVEKADRFIRRYRKKLIKSIGKWTGKNNYVISRVVRELIDAASDLNLYRKDNAEEETLLALTAYINTLVMNYLFTGRLKQCP